MYVKKSLLMIKSMQTETSVNHAQTKLNRRRAVGQL